MHKIGHIAVVVGLVIVVYLLLLVTMPILVGFAETANATMSDPVTGSDLTNYPGSAEAMIASPWVLFFAPAAVGTAAIVIILRKP